MEKAFADGNEIMNDTEKVIRKIWDKTLGAFLCEGFPRISFQDAMEWYGSDKPDLRFSTRNVQVEQKLPADFISKVAPSLTDPIVEVMKLKTSDKPANSKEYVRAALMDFLDSPEATKFHTNPHGGPSVILYDSSKPLSGFSALGFEGAKEIEDLLSPRDGDYLIFQARPKIPILDSSTPLGDFRAALQRFALKRDLIVPDKPWAPLWVVDFPLFTPTSASSPGQGGTAGLSSTHHPFTAPKTPIDVDLLRTDPNKVIADHYDLVINGVELGGGSRRIHDPDLQTYVLKSVLKMSNEKLAHFDHLIEVLSSGCPPHAGIALGMDRLVAMVLGHESVRDVIAFPKTGKGEDPMMGSPGKLDEETLKLYHLEIRDEGNKKSVTSEIDFDRHNETKNKNVNVDITGLSLEDAQTVRHLVERLAENSPKRHRGKSAELLPAALSSIPNDNTPDVSSMSRGDVASVGVEQQAQEHFGLPSPERLEKWSSARPSQIRYRSSALKRHIEKLTRWREDLIKTGDKVIKSPGVSTAPMVVAPTVDWQYQRLSKMINGNMVFDEHLRQLLHIKEAATADRTKIIRPSSTDSPVVSTDANTDGDMEQSSIERRIQLMSNEWPGIIRNEIRRTKLKVQQLEKHQTALLKRFPTVSTHDNTRDAARKEYMSLGQRISIQKLLIDKLRQLLRVKQAAPADETKTLASISQPSLTNTVVSSTNTIPPHISRPNSPGVEADEGKIPSALLPFPAYRRPSAIDAPTNDGQVEQQSECEIASETAEQTRVGSMTESSSVDAGPVVQEDLDSVPRYLPTDLDKLHTPDDVLPTASTQDTPNIGHKACDTEDAEKSFIGGDDNSGGGNATGARQYGQGKEDAKPRYLGSAKPDQ